MTFIINTSKNSFSSLIRNIFTYVIIIDKDLKQIVKINAIVVQRR